MVETKHEKKKAHAGLDIARGSRPLKGWKNFNFEAKAFQRNREFLPNFKVTMRPSYVKERCMAIPAAFAKRYLQMKEAPVSLKVLGGESTWEVKYKCWTANDNSKRIKYKFQDGWNRFVLENQLKVGDDCDFVFTNRKPIRFTVDIYRASENPSYSRSKDPPVACKRSNEEVVDSDIEESNEEPQPKKKKTSRSKATPSVKRKDDATPYKAQKSEKVSAPKLEDLIDFLSEAGRRSSSSRFAHSSNLQGQVSSDSQVVKLMQNLKSLFKHPLNTLCTDSRIRSEMAKLLMELEPIRNNLPASSRGTLASVQDFFNSLSKKVSTINEVVPSFEAEELNRDNLLNTLRSMKTTMDKETRLISAGTLAKLETDKKIVELEAELKEAKLRSLQFEQALSASKEKVRRIDEDSKELGTTARSIVNKLQTMEPEYLAAKADKESLEKTWEEIRNSESLFS